MCLLAFWIPSFVSCLFIFSIKVDILFSLIYKNFLYILAVSPLSILDITEIPHSTICINYVHGVIWYLHMIKFIFLL